VVAGADHFYGGREAELYQILQDYLLPLGLA
jgi:alpha/beta superfamily hydrolase